MSDAIKSSDVRVLCPNEINFFSRKGKTPVLSFKFPIHRKSSESPSQYQSIKQTKQNVLLLLRMNKPNS